MSGKRAKCLLSKFQLYVLTLNWRSSIVPVVVAIIPVIVSVVVVIVPVVVPIVPIIVSVIPIVPVIPIVVAIIPVIVWNWSGLCHLRWCWWDWRRF